MGVKKIKKLKSNYRQGIDIGANMPFNFRMNWAI